MSSLPLPSKIPTAPPIQPLVQLRMYALVRMDLGGIPRGKLMGSAGHAFQMSFWMASLSRRIDAENYANSPEHGKIVLGIDTEEYLVRYHKAIPAGIPCHLVTDLAKTHFDKPTVTCLGIGPILQKEYELLGLKQFPLFK